MSTRVQRECGQTPRAQPQARRTQPRTQPEAPAPVTRTVPIPVRTEPVSLPRAAEGTPSALSGDLVRASATVVTGGVLIWFLQSSFWASLLLLGVPIWRHVDLLPVLSQATDAGEVQRSAASEGQEDAALANVLDTGEAGAGTHGPRGLPA